MKPLGPLAFTPIPRHQPLSTSKLHHEQVTFGFEVATFVEAIDGSGVVDGTFARDKTNSGKMDVGKTATAAIDGVKDAGSVARTFGLIVLPIAALQGLILLKMVVASINPRRHRQGAVLQDTPCAGLLVYQLLSLKLPHSLPANLVFSVEGVTA